MVSFNWLKMKIDSTNQPQTIFDPFLQKKKADRDALSALPAELAQTAGEQVLCPPLWENKDKGQRAWHVDLADND